MAVLTEVTMVARSHSPKLLVPLASVLVLTFVASFSASTVAAPLPTLTASATMVAPGAPVTATIANGPRHPRDWVGLFAPGAAKSNALQWQYLNGTHTAPTVGLAGGTLTFTMPMSPGTYELRFYTYNSNTALAKSAAIKVVAPLTISAVAAAAITSSGATIRWTTNVPSDSQVDFGLTTAYGSTSAMNAALVTAHTVSLSSLRGGTLYHVRVRSRTAGGSLTVSGDVTFTTLTVSNDTTPPVISSVTISAITASRATIGWTTNEASDSQVDFGLTTAYGSTSALNAALVTAHTMSLTGLSGATRYHVRVRSRDAAGNRAVSADVTLTTLDNTLPTVSIAAPAAGALVTGTMTVTANASDNIGVVGVQFTLDGAALGAEDTASPYSVSWNSTTAANGSHTLTAVARDAAGNVTTSAAIAVTVFNDTAPPAISAVSVSAILSSGATIAWTTNEVSNSEVEYGLTTTYGGFSTLDVSLVTTHTVITGGLAPNTLYHFRVRSRDAAGNLALSGDFTVTTLEGTPPTVSITAPANASTVSGTVAVTASAADNGVVGVQFWLDGAALGAEDTASPYSVSWNTATAANGSHTLAAIARDAAGNQTTSAVVVTVFNATGQVRLAWDASPDPTVVGYKVYVGTTSGVYAVSMVDVGNITSNTVSGLQSGTVYYFAVTEYDLNGVESGFSNEVSTTIP